MLILQLFTVFFKIGAFSFGGGYAMIPLIRQEVVLYNYLTVSEFADILAISQITPGPLAINMATFIGYRQAGIIGSLVATFGIAVPSFLFMLLALSFISKFNNSKTIKHIFYGLRPAVVGMIFSSTISIAWSEFFLGKELFDFSYLFQFIEFKTIIISIIAFILMYKTKISLILIILMSAVVGIFVF